MKDGYDRQLVCDACGRVASADVISHHAASGINTCADKKSCLEWEFLDPLEKAARVCERRAADYDEDSEWGGSAYWENKWSADLCRSLAREIRSLKC